MVPNTFSTQICDFFIQHPPQTSQLKKKELSVKFFLKKTLTFAEQQTAQRDNTQHPSPPLPPPTQKHTKKVLHPQQTEQSAKIP